MSQLTHSSFLNLIPERRRRIFFGFYLARPRLRPAIVSGSLIALGVAQRGSAASLASGFHHKPDCSKAPPYSMFCARDIRDANFIVLVCTGHKIDKRRVKIDIVGDEDPV
jgi:hypothetical protein